MKTSLITKNSLKDTLDLMGTPIINEKLDAMVSPAQVRNILIRQDYRERMEEGENPESLFYELAEKHGVNGQDKF